MFKRQLSSEPSYPDKLISQNDNLSSSYNRYFQSGKYDERYPRVNQHVLAKIVTYLNDPAELCEILDFGCGSGRYSISLLLAIQNIQMTAYDISSASIFQLESNAKKLNLDSKVQTLQPPRNPLLIPEGGRSSRPYHLVLVLFGVLSHMRSVERIQTLINIRHSLELTDGKVVLSVPNAKRRFIIKQWVGRSPKIEYLRRIGNESINMYYHLYSVESIQEELSRAGFDILDVSAESFFPESWVTRNRLLGWLDRKMCELLPAKWGYGLLIVCRVKP
jgi:SAM-dependent methyltransferase